MRPWIKYAALFSAGFLCGVSAMGLAFHHSAKRPSAKHPDEVLERLTSKLDLNETQRDLVAALVAKELPKGQALHLETKMKFKTLRRSFDDQLRPLLDERQRQKLEAMEAQWENPRKGHLRVWSYHWSFRSGGPSSPCSPTVTPK
jgi:hypothetical protein